MKDFSEDAFQLLNALTVINEKYNLIEKKTLVFDKGIKVYPSQIRGIIMIGHHPGINVTELARRLEITKASASELISKLTENGLVRKTRDSGNDKEVILNITETGQTVLENINRRHEQMFQDFKSILGELHETNYELVIKVLKRVEYYLDTFIKDNP